MENEDNWRHSFECAIPNQTLRVSLCLFFMEEVHWTVGSIGISKWHPLLKIDNLSFLIEKQ